MPGNVSCGDTWACAHYNTYVSSASVLGNFPVCATGRFCPQQQQNYSFSRFVELEGTFGKPLLLEMGDPRGGEAWFDGSGDVLSENSSFRRAVQPSGSEIGLSGFKSCFCLLLPVQS